MSLARAFDLLGGLALQSDSAVAVVALIIELALIVLFVAAYWIVFQKAGQPGWAAIVPIYNTIVLLRIAGRPWWWLFLMMIPLVNLIILIILTLDIATAFGKSLLFAIGMMVLFPIFLLILAFGDAEYVGPGGRSGQQVRRLSSY
jgi:hypothetical protein